MRKAIMVIGTIVPLIFGAAPPAPAAEFATAEEARAMLDKAIAAVKADTAKALDMFNKADGEFRDRDLYVVCASPAENVTTAHPTMRGEPFKEIEGKKGFPIGKEMMEQATEGKISEIAYWWPRPGSDEPVKKTLLFTKVADQICGVGYYH